MINRSAAGGMGSSGSSALVWNRLHASGIAVNLQSSTEGGAGCVKTGTYGGVTSGILAAVVVAQDDDLIVFLAATTIRPSPLCNLAAAVRVNPRDDKGDGAGSGSEAVDDRLAVAALAGAEHRHRSCSCGRAGADRVGWRASDRCDHRY